MVKTSVNSQILSCAYWHHISCATLKLSTTTKKTAHVSTYGIQSNSGPVDDSSDACSRNTQSLLSQARSNFSPLVPTPGPKSLIVELIPPLPQSLMTKG